MARPRVTARRAPSPWAALSPSASVVTAASAPFLAAAVVVLAVITVIPIIKLMVLMVLYQCVAAVMQPVCDKRIVSCVSGVSKGHKMLVQIVLYSMFLFMISIAITCASTNVNYFAS